MQCLTILISQVLWIAALCGLGSIVFLLLQRKGTPVVVPSHQVLFLSGIGGYLILTVTGTVLNFFTPLNSSISLSALFAGLLFFAVNRRMLLDDLTPSDSILIVSTVIVIWLLSLPGVTDPDTATYHLQVIRWAKEATVPLGLANLHGRLGYNSLWFVAGALIELPFGAKSPFVLNPVMLFLYTGLVIVQYRRQRQTSLSMSDLFLLLTLLPAAWAFMNNTIAANSTDLPVMLLTFLVFYLIARQQESGDESPITRMMVLALASLALTIKLSSLILFLAALILSIIPLSQWRFGRTRIVLRFRSAFMILLVIGAILGPWMARGIATSGCVAFPMNEGCFYRLPWAVPEAFVQYEEDFVKAFARDPGITPTTTQTALSGWSWMVPWSRRWFLGTDVIKIVPLLLFGAAALYFALKRTPSLKDRSCPFIVLSSLLGAFFWFFTAPDFRFGAGYLYSLCIAFLACRLKTFESIVNIRRWFLVLTAAFLVLAGARLSLLALSGSRFATIPEADLSRKATIDGVDVYFPPTGDCWNAPRPCTTFLDRGLRIATGADGRPRMFWFERNGNR